ncbi:MAG: TetR/AcrR family transcriptional regulator [Pseudomonadota bacterium]
MNDTKKLGRPRTFDEHDALMAAMNVFWAKGYAATSMKDLTKAMGISGPSLYAAFGDKRELYLKAIDLYADVDACAPIVAFETEPDIEKAVRNFLGAVIEYATAHESGAKGCFLASCVATTVGEVEGVDARMEKAIDDTDTRLAARFEQEKQAGRLPATFPSEERGRLLFDMRQGYVFRGRAGWSASALREGLEDRVKMVLAP